jgi:dimethylamine/trimethylamine dehydrogenase
MRDARHDILFEPVPIGPVTLPNRFYQVPHCTGFGVTKPFTQAAHRGMKAEGGWGAVCTEYCSISPTSDDEPYVSARLWDDEDVRALRLMTEAVHAHGALAGVELWHGGSHANVRESRLPPLAPSQIANEHVPWLVAQAMTAVDIRREQDAWVAAARRAVEAGFDIVYVYGSHSYLPTQFLSPRTNRRTDAYGGSFENRARFWLDAIERVREAVGDRCAIAVRIAADSFASTGIDPEEGAAFVRAADPLVDLWDAAIGAEGGEHRTDSGASRAYPQGYQLELTRWMRGATAKPMVGVGRYVDPDLMAAHVASGELDVIGAARPSIADPFLPAKIRDGRYDEIRECIGCNQCYSRANYGRHLGCTQNATAGEEHRRSWHPERFEPASNAGKDVLVVGAGPAGLECAIVLAKRGFKRVHLVDAAPDIGGHLRWLPQLPGLGDWARVLDWRRIQLRKLRRQIEVISGEELTADDVREYGAELVVIATGSSWAADGFSVFGELHAAGDPRVVTPEQVLDGLPDGDVAVVDAEGYLVGAACAELALERGRRVTYHSPFDVVAPLLDETLEAHVVRARLAAAGLTIAPLPASVAELDAGAVVLVTQRRSDETLYLEVLEDPGDVEAVFRVGDCVAPRILADAIFDGHRLAREIDGEDPAVPRVWKRERVV